MASLRADPFATALERFLSQQAQFSPSSYLLACSGGCDSMALLHWLATHRRQLACPVEVVYIDHNWSQESAHWGHVVAAQAQAYGLPVHCHQLPKDVHTEERARSLRYAYFAQILPEKGVLLTAHQQNDQAETLLLNLCRGAGLDGLSAMPYQKPFAKGAHWRVWLDIERAAIEAYAAAHCLKWIEDPSNQNTQYRRNFLRLEVLPQLARQFPQVVAHLAQSAELLAKSRALQERMCDQHLGEANQLRLSYLNTLDKGEASIVLRRWLKRQHLPTPPLVRLNEWLRQIASGATAAQLSFAQLRLCFYEDVLYCNKEETIAPAPEFALHTFWQGVGDLNVIHLPKHLKKERLRWSLYPPAGAFKPKGCAHHKPLKEWLRLKKIPPFLRAKMPLLWHEDTLIWCGFLGNDEKAGDLRIDWKRTQDSAKIAQF